jgi:rod shape-determining protein MreD
MRQWAIAVAVLAVVAIIQAYALPYFQVAGVRFDLMMAVLIAWSFVRGIEEAMVVVPLGGFMVSFFSLEPLGASVIAYAPIVPLTLLKNFNALGSEYLMAAIVALLATFAHAILYLIILDGTGYSPDWTAGLIEVTIPAAFMNMLAAPALIYLLRRLDKERREPEVGLRFTAGDRPRGRRLEFR